jgi:hypothetical protein
MLKCIVAFLVTVHLFGCEQRKEGQEQLLFRYNKTLNHLQARRDSLQRQEETSESYVITAQLNQVVRPETEKISQLKNLNAYRLEIQNRIILVEDSIKVYSDSVRLLNSRKD